MSNPYIGEIRLLPYFRGAPTGWQACDGSLLSIASFTTLYQLLGVAYGGDGSQTFGVPDLRSRVPIHQGTGGGLSPRTLGEAGGVESVTLQTQQMGAHAHFPLAATTAATSNSPTNNLLAAIPTSLNTGYFNPNPQGATPVTFPATMLMPAGGSQGHDNTAPTQTMQYCIATEGAWPAKP